MTTAFTKKPKSCSSADRNSEDEEFKKKGGLRRTDSFQSMAEDDDQKKKLLQDFDEKVDQAHMICKRMRHNMKMVGDDIFESITDK